MKIGEALKQERIRLGLTQEKMIHGIIDKGHYSRIERGLERISADSLLKILFMHYIDLDDFFDQVKDQYYSKDDLEAIKLNKDMMEILNEGNRDRGKKCLDKILKLDGHKILKYRTIITIAMFEGQLDQLSQEFKNEIIKTFTEHSNWRENIYALRLLGNCMQIFSIDQLDDFLRQLLIHYSLNKSYPEKLIERLAMICNNYLYYCYYFHVDGSNVASCLNFLKNLDTRNHFIFYKISYNFYYYLFKGKKEEARKIKEQLISWGYKSRVYSWKI